MKNLRICLCCVVFIVAAAGLAGCGEERDVPGSQPVPDSGTPDATGQSLTLGRARDAGIEVLVAGPAEIRMTRTFHGSIRANAEREQDIRARYPGVVCDVSKRVGDPVRAADALLHVESNESLQTYSIVSPIAGRVIERHTNPGDAVDGSTVLLRVADLATVWAEFAVFARDLGQVRPGMSVAVLGAAAEDQAQARISYVAPAGVEGSHSVIARTVLDNRTGRWVPGQFVTGEVVIADRNVRVAVVPTALQELRGKTVVFVEKGDGFEARTVGLGARSRAAIEVVTGLEPGERYAAQNSYLIKADLLKGEAGED